MIDREILATRLSKLREALRRLRPIAAKPYDDYMASEIDRALAEHYLRLSLEAMLDAGNHLIASAGFRKPLQLRDIPLISAKTALLPANWRISWRGQQGCGTGLSMATPTSTMKFFTPFCRTISSIWRNSPLPLPGIVRSEPGRE